jgi:formylglycine-generating enzyme required for sulfatase activity
MIGCWSEARARARRVCLSICVLIGACSVACREEGSKQQVLAASPAPPADAGPPWAARDKAPPAPLGMVWIPPGPLLAGTPPSGFPRLADQELPGEQVMLGGYFIDVFAYPNEEGAIPETGVTQPQAARLCAERGKRLCSELEWERACKGPRNLTYEYGYRYRAEPCLTGASSRMLPSGYRFGCKSEFGARDMHGGVWEWTSDRWGRGSSAEQYVLRGGNSSDGELTGRCANGRPRAPRGAAPDIGFRCCKGEPNPATVRLRLEGRPGLASRGRPERAVAGVLEGLVPDSARASLAEHGNFSVSDLWHWRPIANEQLTVGGGCTNGKDPRCGVIVARLAQGSSEALAWVDTGRASLGVLTFSDARTLWVYGNDRVSNFKRGVVFEWGRLRVLDAIERKVGTPPSWRNSSIPCCRY